MVFLDLVDVAGKNSALFSSGLTTFIGGSGCECIDSVAFLPSASVPFILAAVSSFAL
jgi:hypothetical protein